jgi:hypothetical protein
VVDVSFETLSIKVGSSGQSSESVHLPLISRSESEVTEIKRKRSWKLFVGDSINVIVSSTNVNLNPTISQDAQ